MTAVASVSKQPNIIFILADDLGWNDVSWHNADMPTYNMEQLAREGIILDQSYSQQVCTPSRAALLTGKYPFHIGRQKRALKPLQPTGLQLNLTTIPQQLKRLGYNTHIVGKWHLGYCAWEYTPTRRGFDSFLGFYLGSENHFSHARDYKTNPEDPPEFYDFRENEDVARTDYQGVYSTTIFRKRSKDIIADVAEERALNAYQNYDPFFLYLSFQATHAPLQARAEMLAKIPQTGNPARDIYKAMVLDMDIAIADIVQTLKDTELYNDTIIVFTSDNGGAISHGGSNFPLRGTKGTLFEGGTRSVTFVHGPNILSRANVVNTNLVHITDWMPTLLSMAGYQGDASADLGLDGIDQWAAINNNENVRDEMVYNLKVDPISGAVRVGPHKIIFGKKFNKQGWYDTDNTAVQCQALKKDKKLKRKTKIKNDNSLIARQRREADFHKRISQTKRKNELKKKTYTHKKRDKRTKKYNYHHTKIERKQKKMSKQRDRNMDKKKKQKQKKIMQTQTNKKKDKKEKNKIKRTIEKEKRKKKKKKEKGESSSKDNKKRGNARENLKESNIINKSERRLQKMNDRNETKKDKKITKVWENWLPQPSSESQKILRLRMDDCNWEDFSDSGHSESTNLIPRNALQVGDMVELIEPMLNPFNISSEDEDSEFDLNLPYEQSDVNIEKRFDKLDIAMYNVIEDPNEKIDLRFDLPHIFSKLRARAIYHLKHVVPEDFPPQDFSGHPRNFQGYFSPGWCEPKYS